VQAARRAASSSTAKPNLTGHRNRQVIRRRDDSASQPGGRAPATLGRLPPETLPRRAFRQDRAARCDPESACGAGACPLDCTPDPFRARRHFDVANAEFGERIDDRIERCLVVDGPGDSGRVFNLDEAVGGFPITPIADQYTDCRRVPRCRHALFVGNDRAARKAGVLDTRKRLPERDRLSAGGNRIRTIGSAGEGPDASCVGSLSLRLFGWREPTRGDLKDWSCHAGPMVRILFPPAASQVRTPVGAGPFRKSFG
jgi:hypothetical protein